MTTPIKAPDIKATVIETAVKICGIKNLADARYASGAGADFLGFIQHPSSPRYVTAELAREIIGWVYGAKPVGVFVDTDAESVNKTCEMAGFQYAQLHGNETPAYCEWIDRPIIKAIKVSSDSTREQLEEEMLSFAHVAEYFLFDTGSGGTGDVGGAEGFGGTGKTFNWEIIRGIQTPLPFFLAGGLNPKNVRSAIEMVRPFGVDVASGVESAPGDKDFVKIDAFLEQIKTGKTN